MYLIDTNIFLEFLLGQERSEECIELFGKVVSGSISANLSRFSLYSIEILLTKNKKIDALEKFLAVINYSKGLKIINTDVGDDRKILEYIKEYNLSFDDALNFHICKSLNLSIISLDRHFDKTPVKRIEPRELI